MKTEDSTRALMKNLFRRLRAQVFEDNDKILEVLLIVVVNLGISFLIRLVSIMYRISFFILYSLQFMKALLWSRIKGR